MLINNNFNFNNNFLVVEGVNGAGKSTLIKSINHYLNQKSIETLLTREPGGTIIGNSLRELIFENTGNNLDKLSELFLFAADRAQHVSQVIKPNLEKKFIISDRYYYSTEAFQGYGRGIDLSLIRQINNIAVQETLPSLVILLDIDPENGLKRNLKDNDNDGFEKEKIDFHNRLRKGFLEIAKNSRENFIIINAEKSKDEVFKETKKIIDLWIS